MVSCATYSITISSVTLSYIDMAALEFEVVTRIVFCKRNQAYSARFNCWGVNADRLALKNACVHGVPRCRAGALIILFLAHPNQDEFIEGYWSSRWNGGVDDTRRALLAGVGIADTIAPRGRIGASD
jgi:hypothetical protein